MQKSFHKKKKNVGLLYEILVQELTKNILDSNNKLYLEAYQIIRKNFNKDSELYKELQYYNILSESKASVSADASKIYKKTLSSSINVDQVKLDKEITNLLEDIRKYNKLSKKDLLDNIKVNKYKDLATIQQLLEYNRNKSKYIKSIPQIIELEKCLLESVVSRSNASKQPSTYKLLNNQYQKIDDVTMKILIENYNNKYKDLLPTQKETINNFILSIGGHEKMKTHMKEEYQRLYKSIRQAKKVTTDSATAIKLNEVTNIIKSVLMHKSILLNENSIQLLLSLQNIEKYTNQIIEGVGGSKVFYDDIGNGLKSLVIVDSGKTAQPEEVTIGIKFKVKMVKTNDTLTEKDAYYAFIESLRDYVSKVFYKKLKPVFSELNYGFDDLPARYPNASINFADTTLSPSHMAKIFKFGKSLDGTIEWPITTHGSTPIETIRDRVSSALKNIVHVGVFKPSANDSWAIVR